MMVLTIIISRNNGWMYMNPIVLLMYGIPTFLSGVVMQFTPLKIGGVACWILAITSTFFLPIYYLLFLAAAVIVAWIIPGYLLRKKYNQQNN
jgi:cobalamin biosynthesis protein CobD/CbiB